MKPQLELIKFSNLLSQQEFKNQQDLHNMQNSFEDTNIIINDNNIEKELRCQIMKEKISQNRIFENSMCQNSNQNQNFKISNLDQHSNNSMKFQSFKNFNDQNFQYCMYAQQKNDSSLQQNETQQYNEQSFNHEQIYIYRNTHQQKNIEKEKKNNEIDFSQNNFSKNEGYIKQKQIIEGQISQQVNCLQIKEFQKNKALKNDEQQHNNIQNLNSQPMSNQENNEQVINQAQQQDQSIYDGQKIIQQSDQIKQNNIQNFENISKQESNSYDNQCIFKIFNEIKNYKFDEFEKQIEVEQSIFQVKKVWEQGIFDRVNPKEIQSEIFKSQKQKIFERLKQESFYLCKIINTNLKEDLILGFYLDKYDIFDEYIFKIIKSSEQASIDSQNFILKTLGYQFDLIKLEEEQISILVMKKIDFFQIFNQDEQLIQFKSNIKQVENLYEINSQNCQKCTQCRDEQTCENKDCFNNIKSRILIFLKSQKQFYCEYQNKQIEGIIFQLNQEEFISEYLNFAQRTIFSFQENIQIASQNACQQQSNKSSGNICEKNQNFQQEENIKDKTDQKNSEYASQNMIFQNSVYQDINYNNDQHDFICYQDKYTNNSIKFQIANSFNDQNFQSFRQFQQKNDSSLQKNQQQLYSEQSYKYEQIYDQRDIHQQKNFEKEIYKIENYFSQSGFSKMEVNIKKKQITLEQISQQTNCEQIKESQEKTFQNQKNDEQQHNNIYNFNSQKEKIFDEIKNYKFNEFEKKIKQNQSGFLVKKVWEQEIFDRVNPKEIQSEVFQSQKENIFEKLKQEQFYLCKIINTNLKEDLILGFSIDEEDQFGNDHVFKIIQSSEQANINSQNLILKSLGYEFDLIILEQEQISILVFKKNDYLKIENLFEQLVQFKSNIKQIENFYEINSQNCQNCTECRDEKTCSIQLFRKQLN
ncbi:hypothetical protein ABPG73_006397 [Tetrahymena malaccensis]